MRDIRKDLQERLAALEAEREKLRNRLTRLDQTEVALKALVEHEEARLQGQQLPLRPLETSILKSRGKSPLGQFLLATLSDGRDWLIENLESLAQSKGLCPNGKSPRRAVHFSLVGMLNNRLVEMPQSGVWRIAPKKGIGGV